MLGTLVSLAAAYSLDSSRAEAQANQLPAAAAAARTASDMQPGAATPRLQLALVLERAGAVETAAVYARQAAESDRRDWRAWLVAHHATEKAVWLILYKKDSGVPTLTAGLSGAGAGAKNEI